MNHPQSTPAAHVCRICGLAYPRTLAYWHRDASNPDGLHTTCRPCRRASARERHAADPLAHARQVLTYRQRTRLQVLQHYGGTPPLCACCGEHRLPFLGIDHVDGGGKQQRKTLGRNASAYTMHRWIVVHGFPAGFRVLCHNCNLAIGFYGTCPHEAERAAALDVS